MFASFKFLLHFRAVGNVQYSQENEKDISVKKKH